MGGTEQDSHWAAMIKGTLTQTDTQVVQPFSFHVVQASRNHAGRCTFLFSSIVPFFPPSLCLMSTTALSNTWMPWIHKPCKLSCFYRCVVTFCYQVRSSYRWWSLFFFFNKSLILDHIYSKSLHKCYSPGAVTKIRAWTTATMRASWWATPARAQTPQFAAQRPTNKCFHIYPPPSSLGQLRAEWKAGLWVCGGGVTE